MSVQYVDIYLFSFPLQEFLDIFLDLMLNRGQEFIWNMPHYKWGGRGNGGGVLRDECGEGEAGRVVMPELPMWWWGWEGKGGHRSFEL